MGARTGLVPDGPWFLVEHAERCGGTCFHVGVPSPGNERIHMNLYVYDNKRNPLRHASEVMIEKFEFRP